MIGRIINKKFLFSVSSTILVIDSEKIIIKKFKTKIKYFNFKKFFSSLDFNSNTKVIKIITGI